MSQIERSSTVAASPQQVWDVLADFGAIAGWVPMIQHSCLLSEQTEHPGTVRRVQIARQTLVERVVAWRPAEELAYDIDGLPPIVGTARTTWRLRPAGDGATDVSITTVIDTGANPLKLVIARKVLERMEIAAEVMLTGLGNAVSAATPTTQESES